MEDSTHSVKERHSLFDFLYWNVFALIPLLSACFAIVRHSTTWLIVYIIIFVIQFVIFEYRFFFTHCPHYCSDSKNIQCMLLWGIPKFFKKRPYALSTLDIAMLIAGFLIVIFFPLYWLIKSWQLCIVYFLSWYLLAMTLKRYECVRCIYFDCPANSVTESGKNTYLNVKPGSSDHIV